MPRLSSLIFACIAGPRKRRMSSRRLLQLRPPSEIIAPLNLGRQAGQTVFDLAMPAGSYSDLQLSIAGHDFIATVIVSGSQAQGSAQTRIGSYTIFDLTRQRLGRSTVLHLPASDYRFLHFRIAGPIAPENVSGLSVERLPASEPKYLTVAESSQIVRKAGTLLSNSACRVHMPVDRIVFVPGAAPASFSRVVRVSASPVSATSCQRYELSRPQRSHRSEACCACTACRMVIASMKRDSP